MKTDQLFKDLLQAFFADFLALFLLVNLIETYLTLDDEETEALRAQLRTEGDDAMEAAELTWAGKIMLRGKDDGKREVLLQQLRTRFGAIPPEVEERLAQASGETLDRLAERVVLVHSLEEFETYL